MKAKLTSLILIVHAQRNAKNVTAPGDQIGFAQILPSLLCQQRSKIRGQETLPTVTGAGGGDPGGDGAGGSAKTSISTCATSVISVVPPPLCCPFLAQPSGLFLSLRFPPSSSSS